MVWVGNIHVKDLYISIYNHDWIKITKVVNLSREKEQKQERRTELRTEVSKNPVK